MVRRNFVAPSTDLDRTPGFKRSPLLGEVNVRDGSFTTDAFSTRADQCPLLLQ